MTTKKKTTVKKTKLTDKPAEIDGIKLSDELLAEFLDWSLVNETKDLKMFLHLWKTGFFRKNPITPEKLTEAVEKKIAKAKGKSKSKV